MQRKDGYGSFCEEPEIRGMWQKELSPQGKICGDGNMRAEAIEDTRRNLIRRDDR